MVLRDSTLESLTPRAKSEHTFTYIVLYPLSRQFGGVWGWGGGGISRRVHQCWAVPKILEIKEP